MSEYEHSVTVTEDLPAHLISFHLRDISLHPLPWVSRTSPLTEQEPTISRNFETDLITNPNVSVELRSTLVPRVCLCSQWANQYSRYQFSQLTRPERASSSIAGANVHRETMRICAVYIQSLLKPFVQFNACEMQ